VKSTITLVEYAVELTIAVVEDWSSFGPSYFAAILPLHASVKVAVSAACAIVDRPATTRIAAADFMQASSMQQFDLAAFYRLEGSSRWMRVHAPRLVNQIVDLNQIVPEPSNRPLKGEDRSKV
jgi:hypothetical protein